MPSRSRLSELREWRADTLRAYKERSRLVRVFRHPDFRLLWAGSLLSFIGTWVQKVAEGYLVYQLTNDKALLALVLFVASVPTSLIGPAAGTLADVFDRKRLLILAQSIYAMGAFYLAAATYFGFVTYWQILAIALILGLVSTVEQPTRQSVISSVVPLEDLPLAIPINAMTFNLSRIVGPAIGGVLLATVGTASCYFVNGVSFFALIFSVVAMRSSLKAPHKDIQPIRDLIVEGALYTFREARLKALFILEAVVSTCGLIYITQMPAIAKDMYHDEKRFLGWGYLAVGIGSVTALSLLMQLSERRIRSYLIRGAVSLLGVMLIVLGATKSEWAALFVLAALGMSAITCFNLTNTLFQTLSPPRLRGRVLAMHIWAVNGVGPFGTLLFGFIAERTDLPTALWIGGGCVVLASILAWFSRVFRGVDDDPPPEFAG